MRHHLGAVARPDAFLEQFDNLVDSARIDQTLFDEERFQRLERSVGSEGGSVWECSSIAGDPFVQKVKDRTAQEYKAQTLKGPHIIVDCGLVFQIVSSQRGAIPRIFVSAFSLRHRNRHAAYF
jgi:hypothetical protein